jgi:hypothetical protein
MAPVARGVANAQKDGLILLPGELECLFAPWEPIDRIVLVLEQVWTGFVGKSVRNLEGLSVQGLSLHLSPCPQFGLRDY